MTEQHQSITVWLITIIGILCLFISFNSSSNASSAGKCEVKGNISMYRGEKIYHLPGDKYYNSTLIEKDKGEKLFCSTHEAEESGWRRTFE